MTSAYHSCPRFDSCAVNNCPLAFPVIYISLTTDPQPKCRLPKRKRKAIALKFNLENQGLTTRELSSQKRWTEMPEKEREIKIKNLQENSPITRLNSKGYAMIRKKQGVPEFTQPNSKNSLNLSTGTAVSGGVQGAGK